MARTPHKELKKEVNRWCSRYIRLKEALEYCKEKGIDITQFNRIEDLPAKCCDCNEVKSWIYMDAGHYIGRGLGGGSGVYFDERNIHAQAKRCNLSNQNRDEYEKFMLKKYGQDVIDELERLHRTRFYSLMDLQGLLLFYKGAYEELKKNK